MLNKPVLSEASGPEMDLEGIQNVEESGRSAAMPTARNTNTSGYDDDIDLSTRMPVAEDESGNFIEGPLGNAFSEVILALDTDAIPAEFMDQLRSAIPPADMDAQQNIQFNLRKEMQDQMTLLKGMRKQVFYANGTIREGMEFSDAKYVMQTADTMLKNLMNNQERLVNFERLQKIEAAVHSSVEQMPIGFQEMFVAALTEALGGEENG